MAPERPEQDGSREVRLEGWALLVIGGVVLAALAGAFWLGRWFERGTRPRLEAEANPLQHVGSVEKAAPDDVTFFDTLSGGGKAPEPQREAATRAVSPSAAPQPARPVGRAGPWCVQLFAGRDRRAADEVLRAAEGLGYPVRLDSEREGRGTLFKVRVGGYATRAEAASVAERLKRDGETRAWVTRAD